MPHANVKIVRHGDLVPDVVVLPGLKLGPGRRGLEVVILEGGMSSGLPSVAIRIDVEGAEKPIVAETSLAIFTGIMAAARGAFPEAFEGGPFQAP